MPKHITSQVNNLIEMPKQHDVLFDLWDALPNGIYIVDKNFNIQFVNTVIKSFFGPVDDKKCYQYFHERTERCPWCKNKEVFSGQSVHWEWYSEKNDTYFELFDMPIKNPDGTISKFEMFTDISELKRSEKREKEGRKKLDLVIKNTGVGIWDWNVQTGKVSFNERWANIIGYTLEEISPVSIETWLKYSHPEDLKESDRLLQENWAGKSEYYIFESRMKHKQGHWVWVYDTGQVVEWESPGVPKRMLGTHLDITEEKENQIKLEHQKENLLVTLQSIGDGVITTDIDAKIVLINKITEQLTGWSHQEAVGRPIQEVFNIINEQTGKPCKNPVEKVLTTGQIVTLANHTALIAKDGTQYIIEDSGAPIFDSDSKIIGTVLVYRDVTEERRTKAELMKVKKLESVGVLAGGIAHDFNNILAAILGNIELAEIYTEPTSQAYPLLKDAKKASLRAKDLTQQLLTFAKGGDPVKQTASIGKIITDSANFVLHGSSVLCDYQIPDDLWQGDVDSGQISQVIQNIVINGRDAMPEGGVIEVTCKNVADISKENISLPAQRYIKITIEDTGSGIPEKYLDKIFDPYFSTKQKGSGLGLSICHSIISKHDGNISVESEANIGTKFTIYLPATLEKGQDTSSYQPQIAEAEQKATIMIMDDESMIRDMVKRMLSRAGHEVLQAENGHVAIELYNEYHKNNRAIDIIIMDLTIPGGMGGKDAVGEILKINPDAKVVVASGYSNDPTMAHYQDYGFKASIAKPFQLAELNKLINEVLG
ncbi:MAG: PAS domain S-box protein [Pseudomonadota bacterium]|nr:PAS domain S-box protein [Pseudomonadota bacterium]